MSSPPLAKPPRRRPHIVRRVAGWIVLGLCLLVLGFLLLLRSLDTDIIKRRIEGLVQIGGGLDVDYSSATADILSGLTLRQLTVTSPPQYRPVAPYLLKAGVLRLGWSLFGGGPTVQRLAARDLEVTIVIDEAGHSSLDPLLGSSSPPSAPPPPGGRLADLLASLPDFENLSLQHINVTVLQTVNGKVVATTRLTGLDLRAQSTGARAERRVELALGQKLRPLELGGSYQHDATTATAAGQLWVEANLDARAASVRGELTASRQSLSAAWPAHGVLLAVDATARADQERLHLELTHGELLFGALAARATVELAPGRARVLAADGTANLVHLQHLLPGKPLALREGHLRYDIAGLELGGTPRLDEHGRLEVSGRIAGLRLQAAQQHLELEALHLDIKGRPAPGGGLHLSGTLPVGSTLLVAGARRLELPRAEATLEATLTPHAPNGNRIEVRTRLDGLSLVEPGHTVRAGKGELQLRLSELRLDTLAPLRSSAAVAITTTLSTLETRTPAATVRGSDLGLRASGQLVDGAPTAFELELPVGRLEVADATGAALLPAAPAQLKARLGRLHLDDALPLRSSGTGHLEVALGTLALALDVRKQPEGADFEITLDAPRTSLLTAFAPASWALPGAKMKLQLAASGRIDHLDGIPHLRHHGTIKLEHPSVTISDQVLAASDLELAIDSNGSLVQHELSLSLRPRALALEDEQLGDGQLNAHLRWDARRPRLELELTGEGRALPSGQLRVTAELDRARVLNYRVDGDFGHLAALTPLLPASLSDEHWLDLSNLGVHLASHGQLAGLFSAVDRRGIPSVAAQPLYAVHGEDQFEIGLQHVHYVDVAGVELSVPAATLDVQLRSEGEHRHAEAQLRIPRATMRARGEKLDLFDLHDHLTVSADGDPVSAPFDANHQLALARLEQSWAPLYPVGGLQLSTHARRLEDGTLELDDFRFDNQAGGTHLQASGALVLARVVGSRRPAASAAPPGFSSLGLSLAVEQRLDRLTDPSGRFRGAGTVNLQAELASGDLRRFHVASQLRFANASVVLPARHVQIDELDGTVPVVEDIVWRRGAFAVLPAHESNAYPQLRFSDQHPFLSSSGALRARRLRFGELTIDELAGNLRIARNLLAIDQLDAQLRGGRLAGQCLVDWRGRDSTVQLRMRATGIEATHGGARERFDGNAALTFSAAERNLDGRIEILRIGRHHLYDLLDEYDPHHKDVATNRVRSALGLGYPDRVHLSFDRGFVSMAVSFGGLGRLVRVDEVRGIATGPLVQRYLDPLFPEAP
jgi:hypothetical protein